MSDTIRAALEAIPAGWNVTLEWHQDDWPCVTATLSRDHGRVTKVGHGNAADIGAALAAAVEEAAKELTHD